tara:strand:+ start:321 stop:446 length:126 start_codon:yes stop_codon:yes gene_type:complete
MDHMGYASTNSAEQAIKALVKKGKLRVVDKGKSRNIRLKEK